MPSRSGATAGSPPIRRQLATHEIQAMVLPTSFHLPFRESAVCVALSRPRRTAFPSRCPAWEARREAALLSAERPLRRSRSGQRRRVQRLSVPPGLREYHFGYGSGPPPPVRDHAHVRGYHERSEMEHVDEGIGGRARSRSRRLTG